MFSLNKNKMTTVLTEIIEEKTIQLSTVNISPSIKNVVIESDIEIKNRRNKNRDKNSLYDVFLTLILYTLHFLFTFYIATKELYNWFYIEYTSIFYNDQSIIQRIQYDKSQLTKIPQHLSINVSRELLSCRSLKDWKNTMNDICSVTCWAWEFGIKEVSVYDASGVLKSMSIDLYKQQSTMLHLYKKSFKSEEKERPVIKFTILSSENGKEQMKQVTQEMVYVKDTIDVKLVDEYMHMNTVSDPDLMIVYDGLPHNYISLDGYLPWHIRLTEIINCSNYHHLNYNLFSKCLYKFSKVEQRFGR